MAAGLLRVKTLLTHSSVPPKTSANLLIATWNIRELGERKGGGRSDEPLAYMAEAITAFDIVAIQEVRGELADYRRLTRLLGRNYGHFVTDITVGRPGNKERMAFVYDRRRVDLAGFVGQVVLPPTPGGVSRKQLARTPFFVGFQAGWFRFVLCTAHIYYGTDLPNEKRRVAEIRALSEFLGERATERHAWSPNYVVLGDFNIFKTTDDTYKALLSGGFRIPKAIEGKGSNVGGNKCFDQIAFLAKILENRLTKADGGVLDMFSAVYRDEDEDAYRADAGRMAYRQWRTYQLSDHRPLWIALDIDFTRGFLANRLRGKKLSPMAAEYTPS
jgi:exonuclease III